ncbi:MAG TPA: hypothetical protein VM307_16250 [Egibacteraceae bacterium]|nr:hypothetical protein [Egibacteraceae bacterium]
MPEAQSMVPYVLPSTKWLMALVDFVEQADRPERRDIARQLRAEATRLSARARATSRSQPPTARWARQLAVWLRADPRPEAADLARQVDAWALRLAAKERNLSQA